MTLDLNVDVDAWRRELADAADSGRRPLNPFLLTSHQTPRQKTTGYLDTLDSRSFLKEKLTEKYNYAKTGCPFRRGKDDFKRYYFFQNDGLQNQYVLMTQKTLEDSAEVFFDPNTLAADGTKSLGPTAFSKSGKYWAYGVSASGSDWNTIFVKDIATGKTTQEDKVEWVKFSSIAWMHDDSGFFYSRWNAFPPSLPPIPPPSHLPPPSRTRVHTRQHPCLLSLQVS